MKNEKPNFTLSTVNPVYVFGPQAFEIKDRSQLNTSAEIVNSVLKLNKDSQVSPNLTGYFIDVRDVAKAHISSFENKEIIGKRLLLACSAFSTQSVLDIIRNDFPTLKENLPVGDPSQADDWKNLKVKLKMIKLKNY